MDLDNVFPNRNDTNPPKSFVDRKPAFWEYG